MAINPKKALPEKVYPLGVPFRVELQTTLDGDDEEAEPDEDPTWGDMTGYTRLIRIREEQDTRRRWTTLLHEYIHATLYVCGVADQIHPALEEIIVVSLEHSLEQFLLDHGDPLLEALKVQR